MIERIKELRIVRNFYQGKVRDILDLGDTLLIITSDRISAFDVVFDQVIPNKGIILNRLSSYFFKRFSNIVKNHFITDDLQQMPVELEPFHEYLNQRCMLVKKTRVIPFECICRGYITGSAWSEYIMTNTINGEFYHELLVESQKFKRTLFTPSTKSHHGHDENISYNRMCEMMDLDLAEKIKKISIDLYNNAHEYFLKKGIILADTKFEFGTIAGDIYLIDEIFTPDSSRFWDKNDYKVGETPISYDKQFIRNYVQSINWNKKAPAPLLPEEIITKTIEKYNKLLELIN